MLNKFIAEATNLANRPELTKAEERRFMFLLTAIPVLKAGKSLAEVENDYRNAQLGRLGEPTISWSSRKREERDRLLETLKEIGIKRGYREKVVTALRPDLS